MTELVVGGGDLGGCVVDANDDEFSTQGAKPAGGNVGAQATGYSTGPDAQALTINRSTDHAIVRLDQKTDPSTWDLDCIHLVGPNGANITSPTQGSVPTQGPGPQPLTLDFGASEIPEGTVGIRFDGDFADDPNGCDSGALWTFDYAGDGPNEGPFDDEKNVDQVFAAGGPALP